MLRQIASAVLQRPLAVGFWQCACGRKIVEEAQKAWRLYSALQRLCGKFFEVNNQVLQSHISREG